MPLFINGEVKRRLGDTSEDLLLLETDVMMMMLWKKKIGRHSQAPLKDSYFTYTPTSILISTLLKALLLYAQKISMGSENASSRQIKNMLGSRCNMGL